MLVGRGPFDCLNYNHYIPSARFCQPLNLKTFQRVFDAKPPQRPGTSRRFCAIWFYPRYYERRAVGYCLRRPGRYATTGQAVRIIYGVLTMPASGPMPAAPASSAKTTNANSIAPMFAPCLL